MFTTKRVTTFERYCPHGHTLPPSLLPQSNHSGRFCPTCGLPTEERQESYDAAYCADCNNPVNPGWRYCLYCGLGGVNDESYRRRIERAADAPAGKGEALSEERARLLDKVSGFSDAQLIRMTEFADFLERIIEGRETVGEK